MITIVVAYVHLPATRCAPSFPMYLKGCIVYDVTFHSYLPERFVELVNGNSALVETSPRHNCIVAPKSALLRQAREMVVKAHIIFNKWLKVIPKKRQGSRQHMCYDALRSFQQICRKRSTKQIQRVLKVGHLWATWFIHSSSGPKPLSIKQAILRVCHANL